MGKTAKQKRQKKRRQHKKIQQARHNQKLSVNMQAAPEARFVPKIRVGYISAEFGNVPEADFLPTFFAAADKALFSVIGFQLNPTDAVTRIFAEGTEEWHDLSGKSAVEAAALIREAQLDFLVDVSVQPSPLVVEICALQPAKFVRRISSWCYTPFAKNQEYCVTAPCLNHGYITFGVGGGLFQSQELLTPIVEIMLMLPDSRLLLFGEDIEFVQRKEIKDELQALGISQRILLAEGVMYPYEEIDIILGMRGLGARDLCRALDKSVPVIIYDDYADKAPFSKAVMEVAGQQRRCAVSVTEYREIVLNLARNQDELCRLHRRLHWDFRSSSLLDLDRYIISLEQEYLKDYQVVYPLDVPQLLKQAHKAQEQKDWDAVLVNLSRGYAQGALPTEQLLSLAWGYFFKKDHIRALYWAKKAEDEGTSKPLTALYLQAEILGHAGKYEEAWQVIARAFALEQQGKKMLPEVQEFMLIQRASVGYRVGRIEAAALYWQGYKKCRSFPKRLLCYSAWLMSHNCLEVDRQNLYEKHLGYNQLFSGIEPYSHDRKKHYHSKLRIGYISPDFRAHVMSHFLWPFLATYDHDDFEVFVYSMGSEDQYTDTFKELVDKWQDFRGLDFQEMAARIYADKVDILFDLAGHTRSSGLPVLAYKPAPVQLSGLGYMTTTGLYTVDYFLTDGYVDPPGLNEAYFSEKLLRLTTQFCYTGEENWPVSAGSPCRERGWVLFGVFNHFGKITEAMLGAWQEILQQLPQAKLLIKGNVLGDVQTVNRVYREWEAKGMPMDRVIFEPASQDYMRRYLDVDIALDTYPYPGGGTTCDALYMGVPVITRYGDRHSSRFGYSILSNIGLTELAAASKEEYIAKAVALAKDWELLDMFHQKLRKFMKQSPLMDAQGYIREVENKYQQIWQAWIQHEQI